MWSAPNARDKIKGTDVIVSTNHATFLTNRFSRLISLPTSTIFVSRTSGIMPILKYRSVNPIHQKKAEGHIDRNVVSITIKIRSTARIFLVVMIILSKRLKNSI